jgi:myosin heavy subunit
MKNQFSIKLLTTCILLAAGNTNAASLVLPEEETVLTFDEAPKAQPKAQPKPPVKPSVVTAVNKAIETPLQINTAQVKQVENRDYQAEYQEKLKQANEMAKAAKEQAALAQKIKQEAETAAKLKAAEERKARIEAERQARIKAEEERKAQIEAENQARAQAEAERQSKIQAEKMAKQQAEMERMNELAKKLELEAKQKAAAENARKIKEAAEQEAAAKAKMQADAARAEKLEAERLAKAQADAERKSKLEKERQAKLQADADRKAQIEAERAALAAKNKKQTQVVAGKQQSPQYIAQQPIQPHQASTNYNVDAEELARKSVAEKLSKQAAQHNMFDSSKSLPSPQQYSQGTTALQRATSSIVTGYAIPQNSPKVQALGFRATDAQVKAFDEKYQYNLSQLTPIPQEIADIRLAPIAKLNGDSLSLFVTQQDRQRVEEYLMYHPHYAKVFSNFIKRAMTLNNGHTGSLSVKDAIINELSFKISTISIPSVMNVNTATDSYLYITSRLNDADQVKFWNWVNVVRTGSVVDVPSWVRLVDVMYSSN